MNDLFRFVLMRPADRPEKDETNPLGASFLKGNLSWGRAKVLAANAINGGKVLAPGEEVPDAATARAVVDFLRRGPQPDSAVKKVIEEQAGRRRRRRSCRTSSGTKRCRRSPTPSWRSS